MLDEELEEFAERDLSLLETLDHVLNRGLVIAGEITISVADIDLIFLGLNVLLTSVETAHETLGKREQRDRVLHQTSSDASESLKSAGEDE
jgi:gas vesicle structural protein